jgi:predicted porin
MLLAGVNLWASLTSRGWLDAVHPGQSTQFHDARKLSAMSKAMNRFATGALAMAAALLATPSHADQTLYGTLDLNLSSFRPSTPEDKLPRVLPTTRGKTHRRQVVDNNGMAQSFIGFAGQEKLAPELSARFVLEAPLRADTGSASPEGFWSRNAYVGLDSAYGKARLGRVQTIYFDTLSAYNPFGESLNSPAVLMMRGNPHTLYALQVQMALAGVSEADINTAGTAIAAQAWSNSLAYQSPDFDGISLALQMGLKESDKNGGNHAVAVHVDSEELQIGFAYQSVKTGLPASLSAVNSRWLFGASYDFGMLVAYAQGGQDRYQLNVAGDTGAVRSNYLQFGAKVPVSTKGEALVSLARSRNKPLDMTFVMLVLGYDHHLSLRSDAYAQLLVDKAQLAGIEGDTGVSVALGLRHRF